MAESRLSKTSRFIKEVNVEMQKVTWPTKPELLNATAVVVIGTVLLTAYVGGIDFVMSKIVSLLLTIGV